MFTEENWTMEVVCMNYQQILTFIHKFVLHTNGSKVDAYSIPELVFFPRDFGCQKGDG